MGNEHGDIHWSELVTPDPEKAAKFYSKVIGWTVNEMDMGPAGKYRVCAKGDQMICGIKGSTPEMGDAPPHWATYIAVRDVDQTAKDAAAAGGKVVQPPFDIPGVGRIAMIQDPTGAMIGMMTPSDG